MLAVTASLPAVAGNRPPIVLVHGAANSALVWRFWLPALADAGWPAYALDLRGHGSSSACSLAETSMHDYASDVRTLIGQLGRAPLLIGWSMGGLVSLLAAADGTVAGVVGLAPSIPAQHSDPSVSLRSGEFGAEEYGIISRDPAAQPAMPDLDPEECAIALASLGRESRLARDERAAGVVVRAVPCPLLIVTGSADRQWPRRRYADLHLPATFLSVEGASHWGLVLNRRSLTSLIPGVLQWIQHTLPRAQVR